MNRHRYRIIFNNARNTWMAVAEIARSRGKSTSALVNSADEVRGKNRFSGTLRPGPLVLLAVMELIPALMPQAHAEIVADRSAPAATRPTIVKAANGTTQIDIQRPNETGLSHNRYSRFDVDPEGVILNNARTPVKTELAGWVNGNPNLDTGSARIILNEINAADPSYLRGFVEVAGGRAEVIVANPAGISCSGCGFINAGRATLTTGRPLFEQGALVGFSVRDGEITIEGQGLDGRGVDYTTLIARAVKVNAGIWAQNLELVAGANDVTLDGRLRRVQDGTGDAPAFAVDVKALGGMYAGKILLVGTEQGVGVRNAGLIGASAGDLVLTADGKLVNRQQIESAAGLSIKVGAVDNQQGRILSRGDLEVIAENGMVDNSDSLIHSDSNLTLRAGNLVNAATGSPAQGIEGVRLQLEVDRLDNVGGQILADGSLSLSSSVRVDNRQGVIAAGQELSIRDSAINPALRVLNGDGLLVAGEQLSLQGDTLSGDGDLLSGGDIDLSLVSDWLNSGQVRADRTLYFSTVAGMINEGQLQALGEVHLRAEQIDNRESGVISAARTDVAVTGSLVNRGLVDGGSTRIQADQLENIGTGRLLGDRLGILAGQFSNRESGDKAATTAARNRLDIATQELLNREGALLFSAGDLHIAGTLDGLNQATGKAGSITNESATVEALGQLQIAAGRLLNDNAHFSKEERQVLKDEHHFERQWINYEDYYAFDFLRNRFEEVVTASDPARLVSGGDMALKVDRLINDKSHILAGGHLEAQVGSLENREALLEQREEDRGTVWFSWIDYCGTFGTHKCRRETAHTPYMPAATVTSIRLPLARFEQQAVEPDSGTRIDALALTGSQLGAEGVPVSGLTQLPVSSLYQLHPEPAHRWLVETDPRFTGYRQWLSSDYMLDRLKLDPAATQKRLGDGFYEQRLVQEQITQLTGSRYLAHRQDDEAQFKALMNAGISFAMEYDLTPGIALSAEQMEQLTSDIVWLVEREVKLSDGSLQRVLVPQLYAVLEEGDLNGKGALLGGRDLVLELSGDLLNEGTLRADHSLILNGPNIVNQRGIIAAPTIALSADRNISNRAGEIRAEDELTLRAGGDIDVAAATREAVNRIDASKFERKNLDGIGTLRVSKPGGHLIVAAGHDLNFDTAHVGNGGAGSATLLMAGNEINLKTTITRKRDAIVWDARSYLTNGRKEETGSLIETDGDLQLLAGNDINGRATTLRSDSQLSLHAGGGIRIDPGMDERVRNRRQYIAKSGLFSSKQTVDESHSTSRRVVGSTLSADRIEVQAGKSLVVTGSQIVATGDVNLDAGSDIVIQSGEQTDSSYGYHQERKSGLMTSGFGIMLGRREMSDELEQYSVMAVGSTVGSVEGDVALRAGAEYVQQGSDLLVATGDVDISARDIEIVEAQDRMSSRSESRFKQSGVTLSLSNPVIDAARTVQLLSKSARRTDDPRMQALAAATASLASKEAYDRVKAGQGSTINGREGQIKTGNKLPDGSPETGDATAIDRIGGVRLNISVGSSKHQSSSQVESSTAAGSVIQAGGDITLTTAGDTEGTGIQVRGSEVAAGRDITLDTSAEIRLAAAQNSYIRHDKNQSSSNSMGVSMGMGTGSTGVAVSASSSRGRGYTDATELTHTQSRVTAGGIGELVSGDGTLINGAVVRGDRVIANIGGGLHIESLQDESLYDSEQRDSGGTLSAGPGTFNAAIDSSKTNARGRYASVVEQSGFRAGDEGFVVNVQGSTRLVGGMLEGGEKADKGVGNQLTTGTLVVSHLENRSAAGAEAEGYSLGSDLLTQGKYGMAKAVFVNSQLNAEQGGRSTGETRSSMSAGKINITDETGQIELTGQSAGETVALLERNTDRAHRAAIKQDAERMQRQVEADREIKQAVYAAAVKFTDESYRTIFIRDHPFYEVLRDDNGQPLIDQRTGEPKLRLLSEEEKQDLKPGWDGRVKVFTNGIFNKKTAAGRNAVQMSEVPAGDPVYLIYFPEAENAFSEVLVAGYQYYLESAALGLSNAARELKQVMRRYGATGLDIIGHSRGAMTIGNALKALEQEPGSDGILLDTGVKLVGPAYNAQKAAGMLYKLSDGFSAGVELQNHADDFVGTLIGKNPATYDKRPENSSALKETLQILGDAPTVHSCYGTGEVHRDCERKYGKAPTMNIQP